MCQAKHSNSEILLFLEGEKRALSIFLSWGLRPCYFLPLISIWQMLLCLCHHIEKKKQPMVTEFTQVTPLTDGETEPALVFSTVPHHFRNRMD